MLRIFPVGISSWAFLGLTGRVIVEEEEGRGERARVGVRLITSLQANLYFELIFALPTWRERGEERYC